MKRTMRPHWIVTPIVVMVLGLAGCSGSESGLASPSGSSGNEPNGSSMTPSSSVARTPSSQVGLDEIDACSLLTVAELRAIGEYADGISKTVGTGRVCQWKEVRGDDGLSATLTATIRENAGIDTITNLGSVQQGKSQGSGRDLVRTWNDEICVSVMAVGPSQRVEVGLSEIDGVGGQEACEIVDEVVEIIDPKLPMG